MSAHDFRRYPDLRDAYGTASAFLKTLAALWEQAKTIADAPDPFEHVLALSNLLGFCSRWGNPEKFQHMEGRLLELYAELARDHVVKCAGLSERSATKLIVTIAWKANEILVTNLSGALNLLRSALPAGYEWDSYNRAQLLTLVLVDRGAALHERAGQFDSPMHERILSLAEDLRLNESELQQCRSLCPEIYHTIVAADWGRLRVDLSMLLADFKEDYWSAQLEGEFAAASRARSNDPPAAQIDTPLTAQEESQLRTLERTLDGLENRGGHMPLADGISCIPVPPAIPASLGPAYRVAQYCLTLACLIRSLGCAETSASDHAGRFLSDLIEWLEEAIDEARGVVDGVSGWLCKGRNGPARADDIVKANAHQLAIEMCERLLCDVRYAVTGSITKGRFRKTEVCAHLGDLRVYLRAAKPIDRKALLAEMEYEAANAPPAGDTTKQADTADSPAPVRRAAWLARDALFDLAGVIGKIKEAAQSGASGQLEAALAAYCQWQHGKPSGYEIEVPCWATEIEGLRQCVFHYTPPESHLSWNTAAYALYSLEYEIVASIVRLASGEKWPTKKLCLALWNALTTYDRGFFLRELQYEFMLLQKVLTPPTPAVEQFPIGNTGKTKSPAGTVPAAQADGEKAEVPAATIQKAQASAREASPPIEPVETAKWPTDSDSSAWLACSDIASRAGVPADALRKRLDRWRQENPSEAGRGWMEVPDPGPRQPKYVYRVGAIRHLIFAS